MKIHPVGAELFRADGQTDIRKLTIGLRNFMKEHENKWKTNLRRQEWKKIAQLSYLYTRL
jgi:hypothetical protein